MRNKILDMQIKLAKRNLKVLIAYLKDAYKELITNRIERIV